MSKIAPCLWLDHNAAEAARFYRSTLPHCEILPLGQDGKGQIAPDEDAIVVEISVAGQRFQLLNGGPHFKINPSISFFIQLDDPSEATSLFAALSDGGQVMMPLQAYPWSPCYAWVQDRFGVSWQIIVGVREPNGAVVVPCLMFSDEQHMQAERAMKRYIEIFPDSHIQRIERYNEGEGPVEMVKHARFVLSGQEFIAMDSHISHGFTFSEGLSLSVRCTNQVEVDELWDALTRGGEPGRCGWLKDPFGVSWQIVPDEMVALQRRGDEEAGERMFQAMLGMQRLDMAALEAAYFGKPI